MNEEDDSTTPEHVVALRRFVDSYDALKRFAADCDEDRESDLAERARATCGRLAGLAEQWFPEKSGKKAKTLDSLKALAGTPLKELRAEAVRTTSKWLSDPNEENGFAAIGAIQTLWAVSSLNSRPGFEVLLHPALEFLAELNRGWKEYRKGHDSSGKIKKRAEWLVGQALARFDEIVSPPGSIPVRSDP